MVVSEGAINNIMGGMENTAGVRLHSHRHKLKQRFDIIRKLGQGTYGKVQLAINKETGQEVAIKTIKKAKIETEQDLVRIRREIQIMSSVQHPQIIHIYEVFENREKMVLVMEYAAGGELYDYLSERKVLPEAEARRVFRHVASAVYYCHKHKICHRDLKLENILLDLDGNAKIADFGLSNVFDEKHRLDTFCGSPLYASPEIVKGVPYVGPEVDCWSLGVLLYTLVYGAMPFDGSNFRRLVKQITQGDFYEPATPANASELIRHMLTVQSTERASIEDICSHWWVNEGYSQSCLVEAESLANQTPVRLDLLLSLAPKHISSEHLLIQPEDDESQRVNKGAPTLSIPPPPAEDAETALPPRCHSMGSLPPGSLDIDLLLEKKRQERKEDKKRPHEEGPLPQDKKKKSSVKKHPSRPSQEGDKKPSIDQSLVEEEKKDAPPPQVERKSPTISPSREEDKKTALRPPSEEKKKSRLTPEGEKKKSPSNRSTPEEEKRKEKLKKKEPSVEKEQLKPTKKRETSIARKSPAKKVEEKSVEPKETDVAPSRGSPSPAPSTSSTLKASDSSISRKSVSPVKAELSVKPKERSVSREKKDPSSTEKILQATADKIQEVETLKEEAASRSPLSPQNSVTSSQATTPARSRTESESSSDARPSKSDTSRRQSKILSKAALFEVPGAKSPPIGDKQRKAGRAGALNMTDLAKRFEDKQSNDKRPKVAAPFKVTDARKAFESKTDKSFSESPRRKTSVESNTSQQTSPRESVPTSPTKPDRKFIEPVKETPVPSSEIAPKVTAKEEPLKKEVSPMKRKSPVKEVKKEKSPTKERTPSTLKEKSPPTLKEKSPAPVVTKREKTPVKTVKDSLIKVGRVPSASRLKKEEEVKKVEPKKKFPASSVASRLLEIKADTSDSSDSESEAEKMLRVLSEKREKLEKVKNEKLRKASEMKVIEVVREEKIESPKERMETPKEKIKINEEKVELPKEKVESPKEILKEKVEQECKDQKFATLPRGFKSKASVRPKPLWVKVNSFDEPEPRKKTQMEIVLNQKKQPLIKPQKSFEIKISRDNSRPEFKTEIEHSVSGVKEPSLQRARRERIIPIMMEDSGTIQPSSSSSSKASSASSSRVTNFGIAPVSSTLGSSAERSRSHTNTSDPIKKSRRERIIPIAVEGEGLITPPISESASSEKVRGNFQRQSSASSYNRGRSFLLDRADSFSSAGEDDEEDEDDGFQILTAESLFSTLLSRVRNLTRKMTDDGRPRRTPQPTPPTQDPSGFWSSLYSPPQDSPARRVSEGLSRAQSKEDDSFGNFASPLWPRNSMSRDGSDAESVFSEPNAPFSTLPRGWRSRRSTTREEPEGSFSSVRRPSYYTRALSKDLPDAPADQDRRPSVTRDRRPQSSLDEPSGEANGRVGGQYEARAPLNLASSKINQESVQQLKDLVMELESHEDNFSPHTYSMTSQNQSIPVNTMPSKSFGSFATNQKSEPMGTNNKIRIQSNNDTKPISKSLSIGSTSATFKNSNGKIVPIPHSVVIINRGIEKKKNLDQDTQSSINNMSTSLVPLQNKQEKNVNSEFCNNDNSYNDVSNQISPSSFTSAINQSGTNETIFVKQAPQSSTFLTNGSDVFESSSPNYSSKPQCERPTFLRTEPYRRGKSEDLRTTIDMANRPNATSPSSIKPYRRSKSKDITPTIEAATEKFIQPNSGTHRKISPFEAYRRSKSREMNSVIDAVNSGSTSNIFSTEIQHQQPINDITPSNKPRDLSQSFQENFTVNSITPPLDYKISTATVQLKTLPEESTVLLNNEKHDPISKTESQTNILAISSATNNCNTVAIMSPNKSEQRESTPQPYDPSESGKKEKTKDSKSMYKMLTSKFTRSLSNVGEDFRSSQKREIYEDENNEKGEKFKLKRPSIFLKSKEKSVPPRLEECEPEEEIDHNRGDKKSSKKLSHAFNKFLGRKLDETSEKPPKGDPAIIPVKSTSAAIISDKSKKPPRFRSKNYSKSHENLNKKLETEENKPTSNGSLPIKENILKNDLNLESATKDLCSHLSQIENNISTRIGSMGMREMPLSNSGSMPSFSSYEPPSRKTGRNLTLDLNREKMKLIELEAEKTKKLSGELSEDGSISPNTESGTESIVSTLEDIKEADDDESVMDRITRKSYYSRFNDIKRKPKIRRIDSKESIDQQLAAAKARLMQEDNESMRMVRQSLSPSRMASPPLNPSSPTPVWDGVPRRSIKKQLGPRTTSLPPEDGFYSARTTMYQEPPLCRIQSPTREETRISMEREATPKYFRSNSTTREEPRRSSVAREEQRRVSVTRNDPSPPLRNVTSMTREMPSYSRQSSIIRDEPVTSYSRMPSLSRDDISNRRSQYRPRESQERFVNIESQRENSRETSPTSVGNTRRMPSVSRENVRPKRFSSVTREDVPTSSYQTLPYRKSSTVHIDNLSNRVPSSYGAVDLGLPPHRKAVQKLQFPAPNEALESESMASVLSVASEAGKVAGNAAAAAAASSKPDEHIPSTSSTDSAAVVSAREELSRRLTPLTRLSNMSGESSIRPYRRTATSGGLPMASNSRPNIHREISAYKRTHTLDLPVSESRIQSPDYTKRGYQDPSRRYSGVRPQSQRGLRGSYSFNS